MVPSKVWILTLTFEAITAKINVNLGKTCLTKNSTFLVPCGCLSFKLCRVECRAIFAAAICVVAFAPFLARCNFRGWKHLVPPPPFQKGGRESGASWLEVKCPLTLLGVILYKIKIARSRFNGLALTACLVSYSCAIVRTFKILPFLHH